MRSTEEREHVAGQPTERRAYKALDALRRSVNRGDELLTVDVQTAPTKSEVGHGLETNMARLWFSLVKDASVPQSDTTPPDIHKLCVEQLRDRTDVRLEKQREQEPGSGDYVLNNQLSRGFVRSWKAR